MDGSPVGRHAALPQSIRSAPMPPRKPALVFIFVTLFLDIFGIGLAIPVLPKLIEQFEGGNLTAASHTYGWLAALYALMQFLFAPFLGSLSDRFGRRPVILGSLLGSGLDYLLLAYAPTLPWFFLGRIVSGITGANITAATAYIADVSPPEKRAQNFGLVGAAFGLGFIAGPALGGLLGNIGLRMPFLVAAGLTLLNWLYGMFVLPESLADGNRRAFAWSRANPVGALTALRRYPVVFRLTGAYFLIQLAHQVFPGTWVLYTGHRYDWSVGQVGGSLALVGLTAALVQGGLTRVVVPRMGERRTLLGALAAAVAVYFGYGLATEGWMIYPLIVFGSLGGLATPVLQGVISRSVGDNNEQGAVQGALGSLASVAGITGLPAATWLFAWAVEPARAVHIPGAPYFVGGLLTAIAMVLAARSARVRGEAPTTPSPA
jgi:MFS transporter, DHA1 family, tetracycline resistance protein